jgi:hypothetical protein
LIFEQWLPPLVRLISAALVVGMIVQGEAVSGVMVWLAVLAAALLVVGVVGRAAALILAFVAAFSAAQIGLHPRQWPAAGVRRLHPAPGQRALSPCGRRRSITCTPSWARAAEAAP